MLFEDVDVVLPRDLMVGGLPLQRTASLIALSYYVVRDLLFGSLPATIILQLVALIHRIIEILFQGLSLSPLMFLQDERD